MRKGLIMAYLMIVDDDEDFAETAATVLRNAGHEVRIELDTRTAMGSMKERRPDLVVLDVMFPENSSAGFELARTIKHYENELKEMPVLMLTAVNAKFPLGFSTRDIDDTWLPVSDFLEKPVDLDILRRRVDALLEKRASTEGGGSNESPS